MPLSSIRMIMLRGTFLLLSLCSGFLFAVTPPEFQSPPDTARPWVYWFIMDGNLTKEGITADLESMQQQGIGGVILMEVNVGVPRGDVDFMSEQWQALFAHAVHETERLGLQLTLNSGPGWTGSGGPWITPEKSMWHLTASEWNVRGPVAMQEKLPAPQPRRPFFGEGTLPEELEQARKSFFQDVRVLAFPTPEGDARIADIDEKALYIRAPYSSAPGVKSMMPAPAEFDLLPDEQTIAMQQILDLTDRLDATGTLTWNVPEGDWTILRFAATSTGANTRPAPLPGVGLECSKMDRDAFDIHAEQFIDKLFKAVGERQTDGKAGWCYFHIDSWEMGSQNYSPAFLAEFRNRRGYDPVPYFPAYLGMIVESQEKTERFLWDVRQTVQELIVENHGMYLKEVAHKNNLKLSVEPYDMMPCCNMTFGAVADLPMCEFWSNTFDTVFSCFEAASVAHTHGHSLVAAEAFTSGGDSWQQNPKTMKQRGDWAFCSGVNRFVFHRFQHQPHLDRYPGFSMGGYGIHWERTQTWWPLISGYHRYLARTQHLLQQGVAVVDILYLVPEGAPQVFTPPSSALLISGTIKDQRGYRFDGCDPATLLKLAAVDHGNIAFPHGTKYKLLVLPNLETMTPPLLQKIEQLILDGATVIGSPPKQSPGLQNYPQVDVDLKRLAEKIWNPSNMKIENGLAVYPYGKGRVISEIAKPQTEKPLQMAGAKWIWYPEGNPDYDAPAGKRFFRTVVQIPEGCRVLSATALATADNEAVVYVNGQSIFQSGLAYPLQRYSFESLLKPGENILEIEAVNGESDQRNPAGLVAKFEIRLLPAHQDAPQVIGISTSRQWMTSQDGSTWTNALELGDFGMPPWNVADAGAANIDLYPPYSLTETVLSDMGIPVDFDSPDNALRFFHRRTDVADYYFLANRSETPFDGEAAFRITGKKASIWNPMDGKIYRVPNVREENGQTKCTLSLEGSESLFVVFDDKGAGDDALTWEKQTGTPVMEWNNDWQVSFDAKRGGPTDSLQMEQLIDWSQSSLDGVKYYSGIAVYKKTFDMPESSSQSKERLFLDLGEVEVMARVSINGREVGTRWVAPYRIEITDYLKATGNELVIEVANLWANRLIGDSRLPQNERVTWSTWDGAYHKDSALFPSGLIGPVRLFRSVVR